MTKGIRSAVLLAGCIAAGVGLTACGSGETGSLKTVTETKTTIVTMTAAPPDSVSTEPPGRVFGPPNSTVKSSSTTAPTGPATTIAKDGTYVVGTDIAPGTYKTDGPVPDMNICIWYRLSDLTGDRMDSSIARGQEPGQAFVTIEPGDAAFYTNWCQPWQKID